MAKLKKKRGGNSLTGGEMELLSFLWKHGELTLSAAHQQFGQSIGYTTMQTRLNRLVDKGLVVRSKSRPAKYSAKIAPEDVGANHIDALLERVTQVSVVPLVAQLVEERSLTTDEIDEIKAIIEQAEKRATGSKSGSRK